MKLADTAVRTPEVLRWNPLNKRYAPTAQAKTTEPGEGDDDDEVDASTTAEKDTKMTEIPIKQNPLLVAIYGQICIAAKSYQSAICKQQLSCIISLNDDSLKQFICCMHMTTVQKIP